MAGNKNSGRRPQPTALKILRGNPSKTPLNEQEPVPPDGPVERPRFLSVAAALVWAELAPVALAMGTLTVADVAAFARLCELESTARAISARKDDPDAVFSAKAEQEAAAALRPYYEKFGLEPSGRSRIKVPKAEKPASKWAGVIGA